MLKLPEKHSKKWGYLSIALLLFTFVSLIFVCKILNISIGTQNIIGFTLLSIFIATAISIGGYLGATAYLLTSLVFYVLGIIYMFYVSLNKTAEGWSDLVSIISFLTTVGIGVISGLIIQVIWFLVSKKRYK
ncbi:MAG: hypothetical protein WCN92_05255 [Eubacteriales bacterium]